jgi:hypothetical protein
MLRIPIDPSSHNAEPIEVRGRVAMSLGKVERRFMAVKCYDDSTAARWIVRKAPVVRPSIRQDVRQVVAP